MAVAIFLGSVKSVFFSSDIYSYVSCPRPFSWYANSGATDADKLKNVLSANKITVSDVCMSFDR